MQTLKLMLCILSRITIINTNKKSKTEKHLRVSFSADTVTLWQHCRNVVADVVTALCHGQKWVLCRRQFPKLWQRRCPTFVKTLPQRCCNVTTTLSIGFRGHFITDYSDFFRVIETWESSKSSKWH